LMSEEVAVQTLTKRAIKGTRAAGLRGRRNPAPHRWRWPSAGGATPLTTTKELPTARAEWRPARNRWIWWLGLSALLIVGLACDGEGDTPNTAKRCDTRIVQRPTAVAVHTQVVVRTATKSECDMAPTAHVVHISMDYRADSNASWTPAYRAELCRDIPRPGHPVTCQANAYGICKIGQWRTRVLVTGSGPDGRAFSFTLPEKPTNTIRKC
jgi:hypothetical protein